MHQPGLDAGRIKRQSHGIQGGQACEQLVAAGVTDWPSREGPRVKTYEWPVDDELTQSPARTRDSTWLESSSPWLVASLRASIPITRLPS